ncbi:unnamed protein product, partial [Didymodactylos carnosus]
MTAAAYSVYVKHILLLFLLRQLLTVSTDKGYPTVARAGFHHNALLYIHQSYSSQQLAKWLTGSLETDASNSRILFDAITILAQYSSSGHKTEYSTNKQDWLSFLNMISGPTGILANLSDAITTLNNPKKVQVVIMMPYLNPVDQQDFSPTLNLSSRIDRQQVVEWYIDMVKQQFNLSLCSKYVHEELPRFTVPTIPPLFRNLNLWGIYLMREDILPGINEQIITDTVEIVHSQGLRVLWIPYKGASGWHNWAKFGIDVAILQPGYAFSAPLLGGTLNSGRLRSTAKLAYQYGLGVEIETNQGATTEYETSLLQDYLAEGAIEGYQHAPTAYFLGSYDSIAKSEKACSLIRDYTAGITIPPTFFKTVWNWTISAQNPVLEIVATVPSKITPRGIRIDWSLTSENWQGRVIGEGFSNDEWETLCSIEVGETIWQDGNWTSASLPFSPSISPILALRITFIGLSQPALTNDNILIERVPSGFAPETSTGASYSISPATTFPNIIYGDSTHETLHKFSSGLLVDDSWSSKGWKAGMSIGYTSTYHRNHVRIALDMGQLTNVDRILVYTHGGTYAGINWPDAASILLSSDCVPLSPHSSSDCNITSHPCSDRIITGYEEHNELDQGGYLSFTFANKPFIRWATLDVVATGWLMLDEIQVFSNGKTTTDKVKYRLLSSPSQRTDATVSYPDNGIHLTDGLFTGSMLAPTGWLKNESRTITIDLLILRLIRRATIWSLDKPSWAVSPPQR